MDWVFQYNPKRYDLLHKLRDGDYNGWWNMRERRDEVAVGDQVFFWEAGANAAVTVVGRVTSPAYIEPTVSEKFIVDVRCDCVLERPVTRAEVLAEPQLAHVAIFRGWQGTNFLLSADQAAALRGLVEPSLGPESVAPRSPNVDSFSDIGEAVSRHNARVKAELRAILRSMNPRGFELLVKLLLLKLGYHDVSVTQYVADGGVDARAKFDIGGETDIAVAVQAKRTQSVGRPVVQRLRGSLTTHETGLVITSGTFTAEAVEEARDPAKGRIGLIDGAKLVDIMVSQRLGLRETQISALQLHREQLELDYLEAEAPPG